MWKAKEWINFLKLITVECLIATIFNTLELDGKTKIRKFERLKQAG